MARKKQPKRKSWLKTILFYIFFPLIVWSLAFVAWLYWDRFLGLFSPDKTKARAAPRATRAQEKAEKAPAKPSQEELLDDDRKKLDDILNRR